MGKKTKIDPVKELEKVQETLSEMIIKLQNDEITPKEADAIKRECSKTLSTIEEELKKMIKKQKD